MAEQWIPSADAIQLVAQRYDASERYDDFAIALAVAEEALLKRLSNGALRARAAKGQMNNGDPFAMENESHFENECLPANFWWTLSVSDPKDRELDWVLGDFSYNSGFNDLCASGSLPKLRGLADYVEKHGADFGRIEAVAEVDGSYRALDLKAAEVRELVRRVTSAKEAYLDPLSATYG